MKITFIEGSVEEVIDYLRDTGIVTTPQPEPEPTLAPVSNWFDNREPDPEAVKLWADKMVGRELMFRNKENSAFSHRCKCVWWRWHHKGVYLQCAHEGIQNREFPDKVMRPKTA
jgi:hypothetical protein